MLSKARTDEHGRAFAGSQLQIQIYVNRYQHEVTQAVVLAINSDSVAAAPIRWVSPLEQERFREYKDAAFLQALNVSRLRSLLAQFWPPSGPRWDALGSISPISRPEPQAIILVEAKSSPDEVFSFGCRANEKSRPLIEHSLARTRTWLGAAETNADNWMGALYQYANRLAHLYFFREIAHIEAWLVNIYFITDPRTPTSLAEWQYLTMDIKNMLGLPAAIPYTVDVFLPAYRREVLLAPHELGGSGAWP